MITTIYKRFFVAKYEGAPRGEHNQLHEWNLCRDENGIPLHWGNKAGAEFWIDGECDGSRSQKKWL
jgi:hypothetical protein